MFKKITKQKILFISSFLLGTFLSATAGWLAYDLHTASAAQNIYTVTTNADAGAGSLRQAILDANAEPTTPSAPHRIEFNIPGTGVHTIAPQTLLPAITNPTEIDGTTQPGSSCGELVPELPASSNTPHVLNVEISYSSAPFNDTLRFSSTASNSKVKGLIVNGVKTPLGMTSSAHITVEAQNMTIECNYIGTDSTGMSGVSNGAVGIWLQSDDTTIQNNLLSGSSWGIGGHYNQTHNNWNINHNLIGSAADGKTPLPNTTSNESFVGRGLSNLWVNNLQFNYNVMMAHSETSFNLMGGDSAVVKGNYIGVDITGIGSHPNGGHGLYFSGGTGHIIGGSNLGEGNIIAGKDGTGGGIVLQNTPNTSVVGNMLGVGIDKKTHVGSNEVGIGIGGSANNIVIGGGSPAEGNVITAEYRGITDFSGSCDGRSYKGNYIGVAPTGESTATTTMNAGILIGGGSCTNTTVGGSAPNDGNVVGNTEIGIYTESVIGIAVYGNFSGVDRSGRQHPNQYGIATYGGANNQFGGTGAGEGNVIAYNTSLGVSIHAYNAVNNVIRGNSMYMNGGMGIDLFFDGPTPNDPLDSDTGPNNLQNYPITTSSMIKCDGTTDTSNVPMFSSTPNTTFTIDYYANPSWDPSGTIPRQGETWHSSETVTTDAQGNASLTIPNITYPSATATDPSGNTSEFGSINTMRFDDCQTMDQVVIDTSKDFRLGANWTGTDIPTIQYSNYPTWNDTTSQYEDNIQKTGLTVSLTVNGQPLQYTEPPAQWNSLYSFSGSGWNAIGHLTTALPDGQYDVTLTLTDPITGLSMTHTYVKGLTVKAPKITYTTMITNNQTPTLHGSATDVYWLSNAYIVPKGTAIDWNTPPKERVLVWQADKDASGNELTTGSWKIVTSKTDYVTKITADAAERKLSLYKDMANWFASIPGVDATTVTSLSSLQGLCTNTDVQQRIRDWWGVTIVSEQDCRDWMQQQYNSRLQSIDDDLQAYIDDANSASSHYDFTAFPEGSYDIYLIGAGVNRDNFTHPLLGGLIVDLTNPTANLTTTQASVSPALTGTVSDPSATVTVTIDGKTYTATNDGNGSWVLGAGTITPLKPGSYDVTVTVTDAAGNSTSSQHVLGITKPADVPTASGGSMGGQLLKTGAKTFGAVGVAGAILYLAWRVGVSRLRWTVRGR